MNITIQEIKTPDCPIEGWKESDNCLHCKFFGGLIVAPCNGYTVNVSLICKMK